MWTPDPFKQEISKQMMKDCWHHLSRPGGMSPEWEEKEICAWWLWEWRWGRSGKKRAAPSYLEPTPARHRFWLCPMLWVHFCAQFIPASISCGSISKLFWESHIMKTCQRGKMTSVSASPDSWLLTGGGLMFLASPLVEYYIHHLSNAHGGAN